MASLDKDEDFFDSFPLAKGRKLTKTSSQKWIICGGRSKWDPKERKSCGNLSAVKRRKDNVFRRLAGQLEDLDKEDVHWYSSCYSNYTRNQNIRYAIRKAEPSIV